MTEKAEIAVRRRDGALLIGSPALAFQGGDGIDAAKETLGPFLISHDDYRNGWQCLRLRHLSLSGWDCEANLRFEFGKLKALDWYVARPEPKYTGQYAKFVRSEIAAQLELMRLALSHQLGRSIEIGVLERFEWGTTFCVEDTRSDIAITRLNYVPRTLSGK
jgi:hypothetical protein